MRAVILAVAASAVTVFAQAKPDFTGVWKLSTTRPNYSEIWNVKQSKDTIQIRMEIKDDQLGDRTLLFSAPLDGKERKQTVIGTPATVKALLNGQTLTLEIRRQARPDLLLHNSRHLRLSAEGKRIESQTTIYSPAPAAERTEVFDRQ